MGLDRKFTATITLEPSNVTATGPLEVLGALTSVPGVKSVELAEQGKGIRVEDAHTDEAKVTYTV